jgi:hypothetical protein
MASGGFYRPSLADQVSQGDIFDAVPKLHLKPPLAVLRRIMIKGGVEARSYLPVAKTGEPTAPLPGGPLRLRDKQGEQIECFCQVSRAILLTYDCEIDHDEDHRMVALVRPLTGLPAPSQDVIRNNQNFIFFYLPGHADFGEGYVDFRRVTCLTPSFLDDATRIASLSSDALMALQRQLLLYLTRRELSPEQADSTE